MTWETICDINDVPKNAGVAALVNGHQIAIFNMEGSFYATDNWCPFANANVISRGILCSLKDRVWVASPMYKQHFSLEDGSCMEDDSVSIGVYDISADSGSIEVDTTNIPAAAAAS